MRTSGVSLASSSASSEELRQERNLIFFLALVHFTNSLDFVIMMPLGPQFMRIFEIGPSEFGLLVSSYTFSAAIFGIIGALFIDRFDRKKALLSLYAGFTIATLFCALSPSHHFLLIARALAGAFGGILGAVIFSIIGDRIPEKRRGTAMGKVMAATSLAAIVGIPIALKLSNIWNWRAPFFFLSTISTLFFIAGVWGLPIMREHLVNQKVRSLTNNIKHTFSILMKPDHIWAYLFGGVIISAGFLVIPYISPSMVANAKLPEADLFYIYLIGGSFTFFTSPLVGRISDRYGKFQVFLVMALISILPVFVITHLGPSPMAIVIASTTFFMIFSSARMVPAMTMITSSVRPEDRGGFMSINSSFQQFCIGSATFLASRILMKGPDGTILHYERAGYLSMTAILISIWLGTRIRRAS